MARALAGTIVLMSVLAELVGAQAPSIGLTPSLEVAGPPASALATFGEPQVQLVPLPTAPTYTGTYTTVPRPASDPVSMTRPGETLLPSCPEGASLPRLGNPWFENLSL